MQPVSLAPKMCVFLLLLFFSQFFSRHVAVFYGQTSPLWSNLSKGRCSKTLSCFFFSIPSFAQMHFCFMQNPAWHVLLQGKRIFLEIRSNVPHLFSLFLTLLWWILTLFWGLACMRCFCCFFCGEVFYFYFLYITPQGILLKLQTLTGKFINKFPINLWVIFLTAEWSFQIVWHA